MVLAPELIGLLGMFALVCALIALSFAYHYTLGAMLRAIASLFDIRISFGRLGGVRPFHFASEAITKVDKGIQHGLGVGINAAQYGFNRVLQALAYTVQQVGDQLEGLAQDTLWTVTHLRRAIIPALIKAVVGPLALIVYALRHRIASLAAAVARGAVHIERVIVHELPTVRTKVERVTRIVYRAVPAQVAAAVAIPWGAIHGLERDVTGLEKWVRSHGKTLAEAGAVGLVAAALARLGLGWAKCSKWSRYGPRVCGLDESLLESLLADALLVASTISIVELAKECQSFTRGVETPLRAFVRELRDVNPVKAPKASAALARYAAGRY